MSSGMQPLTVLKHGMKIDEVEHRKAKYTVITLKRTSYSLLANASSRDDRFIDEPIRGLRFYLNFTDCPSIRVHPGMFWNKDQV